MRLNLTHGCFDGPYSAFNRWRTHLAELGGFEVLWGMASSEPPIGSFDKRLSYPITFIDWGHISEDNLMGEWDTIEDDALIYLIAHYDTDGVIHPEEGTRLALRLEELLERTEEEHEVISVRGHRERTEKFIEGLKCAFIAGEDVEFH